MRLNRDEKQALAKRVNPLLVSGVVNLLEEEDFLSVIFYDLIRLGMRALPVFIVFMELARFVLVTLRTSEFSWLLGLDSGITWCFKVFVPVVIILLTVQLVAYVGMGGKIFLKRFFMLGCYCGRFYSSGLKINIVIFVIFSWLLFSHSLVYGLVYLVTILLTGSIIGKRIEPILEMAKSGSFARAYAKMSEAYEKQRDQKFHQQAKVEAEKEKTPYEILCVSESVTWDDIKASHRRLAQTWHEAKWVNGTAAEKKKAEEELKRVNAAYDKLKILYGEK